MNIKFKDLKIFILSVSVLAGTIIGVGIFSLPYITSKVGIKVMLGYFLVLTILVILIHLFYGELALKTPDFKRLPGFAKIYLGKNGEKIALFSSIIGLSGGLLIYLIVGSEFLKELFNLLFNLNWNNFFYIFFYLFIGAALIFFEVKAIAKIEFFGLILFFLILIFMFFIGQKYINIENLSLNNIYKSQSSLNFFLPYGAVLFSLWGTSLIPETEEMLKERKNMFRKVIIISTIIPVIVYIFFIYLILGIAGSQTTEFALTGLKNFLNNDKSIIFYGLFFGILTTFTSFITLGLTLKKIFYYDLKIEKNIAWLITCLVPLILFLIGINQFIPLISFIGGIMLGIDGILILLMYKKIHPRNFLIYPLFLIFLFGIIYEIIYFIK